MTGMEFGRLKVLRRAAHSHGGKTRWVCKCACGKIFEAAGCDIRRGHTTSCGCFHTEVRKSNMRKIASSQTGRNNPAYKHGACIGKDRKLYWIWSGIIQRCTNPRNKKYYCYGGRGISLSPEWRNSYKAFETWALRSGYEPHLTIERINVNGNYCPENCTWIPANEQSKNRRPTKEWRKSHG
jgi:hypothetical protein